MIRALEELGGGVAAVAVFYLWIFGIEDRAREGGCGRCPACLAMNAACDRWARVPHFGS
jgi:hypothetical protein